MSLLEPFRSFFQSLRSQLESQYYLIVIAVLGLLIFGAVTYAAVWWPALRANPWFWGTLALLVAVGLVFGIRYGLPRLRERSFLRRSESDYVVAGQESPEEFTAKFLKALQALRGLPQLKGRENPLYALPWYLLIGEEQSGKTAALQGANLFSPLLPSADKGGTQNCDWWLANTAVVLDTAGRYVTQADKARDRAEWYRLLRLLRQHREHEPINGIIITMAAPALATQPEDRLRAAATRLRDRCEEAVRELGCDAPVYLLVTKCDQIEGFGQFFSLLPRRVLDEVLGHVNDSQAGGRLPRGEDALVELGNGLATVYERLHRFRLSLLDAKGSEPLRQAIFCFPEEVRALHAAIEAFATPLFSYDTRYHTPMFRGIFFSSARQQGAPVSPLRDVLRLGGHAPVQEEKENHYFLADLFRTIIPRDRGLVTITTRERRRRGFSKTVGVGSVLGLGLLLTGLVFNAYRTDRALVQAADLNPCPDSPSATTQPDLAGLEACEQVVQDLINKNRQRSWWSTLGWFTKSFALEGVLRERYAQNFQARVLAPLNVALEQAVEKAEEPMPLLLFLARRVRLEQTCVLQGGCPQPPAEELQPDYALMLHPQGDRQPSETAAAQLQTLYTTYLSWQKAGGGTLRQDLDEDKRRLTRWLEEGKYSFDRLLALANRRSPPITYEKYWELPAPLTAPASPAIEPACTKHVWEQDIAVFLNQLQSDVPDLRTQLLTFLQSHGTKCLAQWERFLREFPGGAERWKGPDRRQELARRILTEASPYQRVLTDTWTNVAPWAPEGEGGAGAEWVGQLRNYFSPDSEARQAYIAALRQIEGRLQDGPFPDAAFTLASEVTGEGKPSDKAANPVQRAWFLASQFSQPGAAAPDAKPDLWRGLLQEPVQFVWRVILEQAYQQLQRVWTEQVMAPVAGLPPAERLIALYEPGGKVEQFEQRVLAPLLKGNPLPGEKVPLPPSITDAVESGKQLRPPLEGNIPYPVQVRVGRRPDVEGSLHLREALTVLTISCTAKTYRLTTTPRDSTEVEAIILWSRQACSSVSLVIYFTFSERPGRRRFSDDRLTEDEPREQEPRAEGQKRVQLTKRYEGPAGFLRFLHDFSTGSHSFPIDDFEPDPEALTVPREGILSVNVYYTVRIPPQLEKLTAALRAEPTSQKSPAAGAAPLT